MKPRAKVRPTTPGRRFGSASRLPPAPGEPAHVAGARAAMMDRVRFQSSRAIYGAEGRQSSLTLDVGDVAVDVPPSSPEVAAAVARAEQLVATKEAARVEALRRAASYSRQLLAAAQPPPPGFEFPEPPGEGRPRMPPRAATLPTVTSAPSCTYIDRTEAARPPPVAIPGMERSASGLAVCERRRVLSPRSPSPPSPGAMAALWRQQRLARVGRSQRGRDFGVAPAAVERARSWEPSRAARRAAAAAAEEGGPPMPQIVRWHSADADDADEVDRHTRVSASEERAEQLVAARAEALQRAASYSAHLRAKAQPPPPPTFPEPPPPGLRPLPRMPQRDDGAPVDWVAAEVASYAQNYASDAAAVPAAVLRARAGTAAPPRPAGVLRARAASLSGGGGGIPAYMRGVSSFLEDPDSLEEESSGIAVDARSSDASEEASRRWRHLQLSERDGDDSDGDLRVDRPEPSSTRFSGVHMERVRFSNSVLNPDVPMRRGSGAQDSGELPRVARAQLPPVLRGSTPPERPASALERWWRSRVGRPQAVARRGSSRNFVGSGVSPGGGRLEISRL